MKQVWTPVAAAALMAAAAVVAPATVLGATALPLPTASAGLPDGRAYEQVSPVDKNGYDVDVGQPSADGNGYAFSSFGAFAGQTSGVMAGGYVARRAPGSWLTTPVALGAPSVAETATNSLPVGYSSDLSEQVVSSFYSLTPGAPTYGAGFGFGSNANLYRRAADGMLTLLSGTVDDVPAADLPLYKPQLAGMSTDLTHAVISSTSALTPGATPSTDAPRGNLYDVTSAGRVNVGILPSGAIAPQGAWLAGQTSGGVSNPIPEAVSRDGSRIFFGAAPTTGVPQGAHLYVRIDGGTPAARTLELTRSRRAGPSPVDEEDAVRFWAASPDGTRALFTSRAPLTDDSTANDLYLYDVDHDTLQDLSVATDPDDGGDAQVWGVMGNSADLSVVYFSAYSDLAPGATSGQMNLYRWSGGQVAFVATAVMAGLAVADTSGDRLAFVTSTPLTGYDNMDSVTGNPHSEVYLYDAGSDTLACASCDPSGASPRSDAVLPPTADLAQYNRLNYWQLSENGQRLFFLSADRLTPGAGNARQKLYEYSQPAGGHAGSVALLSGGASDGDDQFAGATASGNDVFLRTREQLVPGDTDALNDIYDVRVGGGMPASSVSSLDCTGDACQGAMAASPFTPVGGSETASGTSVANDPPPTAASFTVTALTAAQRTRFAKTGRATLKVTTTRPATVKAVARAKVGGRTRTVASSSSTKLSGGTRSMALTLSTAARRQLATAKKLKVRITVTCTGAEPRAATVTLTAPKTRARSRHSVGRATNHAAATPRTTRKGA